MDKESLGCFYLFIDYPGTVHLECNKSFFKKDEDKLICFSVQHKDKYLVINDYENCILTSTELVTKKLNTTVLNESITLSPNVMTVFAKQAKGEEEDFDLYVIDSRKQLYYFNYTTVAIIFECFPNNKNHLKALNYLDQFISAYRFASNDILLQPYDKVKDYPLIIKEAFHTYTDEDLINDETTRIKTVRQLQLGIRQVRFPHYRTQGRSFDTNSGVNGEELERILSGESNIHQYYEYVLKAREELYIHENYKYSFIESWVTIEKAVVDILRRAKLDKGISKNKIDEFQSEVGISYLISIELMLAFNDKSEEYLKIISDINKVRKKRNKVIHLNEYVSQEDAKFALDSAINLLNHFSIGRFTKPNQTA